MSMEFTGKINVVYDFAKITSDAFVEAFKDFGNANAAAHAAAGTPAEKRLQLEAEAKKMRLAEIRNANLCEKFAELKALTKDGIKYGDGKEDRFFSLLIEVFIGYFEKYLHPDADAMSSREKDKVEFIIECYIIYDKHDRLDILIDPQIIINEIEKAIY